MPKHEKLEIIPPMLAKAGRMPANQSEYGFEIKWDGIRIILYYDKGSITLLSRNLLDITNQYPEISAFAPGHDVNAVILDGEIIATDTQGRPSFSQLQHRMGVVSPAIIAKLSASIPVTLVIFDVLSLNGQSLLDYVYTERRDTLATLNLNGTSWQTPTYNAGEGDNMLEACRRLGLEGIVAKRLDSRYLPGKRPGTWLKIKNQLRQELVIAGWALGQGARSGKIGALLVGYYNMVQKEAAATGKRQQLLYAGAVGTGFNEAALKQLADLLQPLTRQTSPFTELPPKANAVFTEPVLVGEFEFTEWTPNGTLRHPSFKGLRYDKDPKDIIREPTIK